ncbi:MAG: tRNA (N(6)-L-threonylcarbamoyladenosine(37)-C(2))-methylthiotransferase MtaB [Pseudothermotoga sp.]
MKRVYVTFLGCKVNQYETEYMIEKLEQNGFVISPHPSKADFCVLNTCMVTSEASRKSRQMLRKLRRLNPKALIIATGCYAHLQKKELIKIGADLVLGNDEKIDLVNYIQRYLQEQEAETVCVSESVRRIDEKVKSFLSDRTRAYIKVEDGCNEFCSYCIVPFARGYQIRSKLASTVVEEAKGLLENGYREIVLTGINLGKYGVDQQSSLSELLKSLLEKLSGDFRIRLSSINVQDITSELIELFAQSDRICPHLHIPIQSGSNTVLLKMNRKYTVEDAYRIFDKLRGINPDFSITTDVIVGFPGETVGDFKQTLEMISKVEFSKVHIFRYSSRPGTVAVKFNYQVPSDEKERRSKELHKVAEEVSRAYREKSVGKLRKVLVEQMRSGISSGYDEYYVRHEFTGGCVGNFEIVSPKCVNSTGVVSRLVDLEGSMAKEA